MQEQAIGRDIKQILLDAFRKLAKAIIKMWEQIKEHILYIYRLQQKRPVKRQVHKLNLSRISCKHQVFDRKPKYLHMKIIN